MVNNIEKKVIDDFGNEWKYFNQNSDSFSDYESLKIFNMYFDIFPFSKINSASIGMDLGCGTGRWIKHIAPKVNKIIAVDPSLKALKQAKMNLNKYKNVEYLNSNVFDLNIKNNSLDFVYSLGVLHHVNETQKAIRIINDKLKSGSPFLIYLYYALDNRPIFFRGIWFIVNMLRIIISRFPFKLKLLVCNILASILYFPLAKICSILKKFNINIVNIPLSFYHDKSFYSMRTDSLDRFGTKLEKRYRLEEIKKMLRDENFIDIIHSKHVPFWCVLGIKK